MKKRIAKTNCTYLTCILCAIVISAVYVISLCPTVYLIDSGELATISYTLGIAHPTGYPLYTLLSYFFAHLPGEPIWHLNLLSAVFSVAAAVCVYVSAMQIIRNTSAAAVATALFAFAPTIWRVSVTNEVYPLTALFCVLILTVLVRTNTTRHLLILTYIIGLAFTNHVIVFSLALPVLTYLLFVYRPRAIIVVAAAATIVLAVSLYMYLMARTSAGPAFAWGNTCSLQRMFWHITGKQYQVWMFSLPYSEIATNLKECALFLLRDFIYVLMLPVLIGMYHLYKKNKKMLWLLASIILLNILYSINYSIPDIESYYIPAFTALIFLCAYGLRRIASHIKWYVALPVVVILPLLNYNACTLRNNTFGLDFSRAHIEQLPRRSLLICTFWDIYSPLLYLRAVKGHRIDLVVIDKELLRRTWYIDYLRRQYPQFMNAADNDVNVFLAELLKFEYDQPYDPAVIQLRYIKMLEAFVDNPEVTGVYLATPVPDNDLNQVKPVLLRMPRGMVFELRPDAHGYVPFDYSRLHLHRPPVLNDARLVHNIGIVKQMTRLNISFLTQIGPPVAAAAAQKWLQEFDDRRPLP